MEVPPVKKALKFCAAVLTAAVLTVSSGCSARSAISADDFQKQAKGSGFSVSETANDNSGAERSLTALKDGTDVEIDYHIFSDESSAQNWYVAQKGSLAGSGKVIVDSDSYNKYTLVNGEIDQTLVRMDKTAVLCKTTAAKKSEADNFLKAIHY